MTIGLAGSQITGSETPAPGGGGGAPTNAQYVTLAVDGTLTNERTLAVSNLDLVDAGAGNAVTIGQSALRGTVVTASPGSNQNDYNPTDWDGAAPSKATHLRLTPSASVIITGLAGGSAGRIAFISNESTDYMVMLPAESVASTAANRFAGIYPLILMPGDSAIFNYNTTQNRWMLQDTRMRNIGLQCNSFDEFNALTGIFGTTVSGTGASGQTGTYLVNSTEKPVGVYQVDSGTTATGRAHIGFSSNNSIVPAQGCALFLCRVAVEALSNGTERYQIFAGFHDAQGGTNITDGICWSYRDDVNAAWLRESAAASTRTQTASSKTVDTNYIWLGIFVNANWSRADYFWSDNSTTWAIDGSNSTNMPSSTQLVSVACGINKTLGTTQRNLSVDFMGYRYDLTRG